MKIVQVIDNLYAGGKQRRLLTIVKGLIEKFNVHIDIVLLRDEIMYDEVFQLPVKVYIINRRFKKDPMVFVKLSKILKESRPDIIHSWGGQPSTYVFLLAKFLKIKFVNGLITNAYVNKFSGRWFWAKLTFSFSDIILSNSFAGAKNYGVPKKKQAVILNGFDFRRIKTDVDINLLKHSLGIEDEKVIGMIGSLDKRKDFDSFIKAAIELLKKNLKLIFLIIGEGSMENKLKQLIPNEFTKKIKFLGYQSDVDVLIRIIDIGVLMTDNKYHLEGISNTIMEYMANGIPVVASNSGGTKEIVIHNKTGYIIKPYSFDILADNLEQLLKDKKLYHKFSKNGKERIENKFSYDDMIDSIFDLYSSIICK